MRRLRVLVPLILAAAAALPLSAAEGVTASTSKRGNVRFGPSKDAPLATTLPAGTQVELLAKVQKGSEIWYQIRFPRTGKAWMHKTNLLKVDDKNYKVTQKARVRADSTMGADIVAEVEAGDIVEYMGTTVGDWLLVYPPKAVAYVSEIVLDLPQQGGQPAAASLPTTTAPTAPVVLLWPVAKQNFAAFANVAKTNQTQALQLDWPGLEKQLAQVVKDHPDLAVRLEAARYRDGVEAVVKEQARLGHKPASPVPQPTAEPAPQPQPVAVQPVAPQPVAPQPAAQPQIPAPTPNDAPIPAPTPVAQQPVVPAPTPVDAQPPVAPQPPVQPAPQAQPVAPQPALNAVVQQANAAADAQWQVKGFLEQQGDTYRIVDNTSTVLAIVKPLPGGPDFGEFHWREVGIRGMQDGTAKDEQGRDVPVYRADAIGLISR